MECSQTNQENGVTIVLDSKVDSLLHDTVSQNFLIDSLKKVTLNSLSDSTLVKNLCLLAKSVGTQNRFIYANEIVALSKKNDFPKEEIFGQILVGTCYSALQNTPKADSLLDRSIKMAKKLGDDQLLSRAYMYKGELNRLSRHYDSAEYYYQNSLLLAQKNNYYEVIAFVNSTWSDIIHKEKGDYKRALAMNDEAIVIARRIKDYQRLSYSLANKGEILRLTGQLPEALNCMLEGLHYSKLMNNKGRMVYCLQTIGNLYTVEDDFENAEKNYLEALDIATNSNDKYSVASITASLGTLYVNTKEFEKALVYNKKALLLSFESNDLYTRQFCLYTIGESYIQTKMYDSAQTYLFSAIELDNETKSVDIKAMCFNSLNRLFLEKGELKKAEEFGKKGLDIAMSTKTITNIKESSFALFRTYKSEKQFEDALKMHELYMSSKDSVSNLSQIKTLEKVRYKSKEDNLIAIQENKNRAFIAEKAAKDQEIKSQKLLRNMFVFGFIAIGLLAYFIFRSLVLNRKAKKLVEEQKRQVEIQKAMVEEHQKEIIDSITYARRIQRSLLPTEKYIEKALKRLKKE